MKFRKINVHPLRGADPRLRAVANILTADGYAINGIRVYDRQMHPVEKERYHVDWDVDAAEKGAWKAGRAANFAFTPCTHAARREIEGAILEAYKMKTGNVAGFEQRSVQ